MKSDNSLLQFFLKVKKGKMYVERVVEILPNILKYYIKDKPKDIRFQADLLDLVLFEKYSNENKRYKVIITSKTNSFPKVNFRPLNTNAESIKILQNFKLQIETNIENLNKLKKRNTEIIMRVEVEEKVNINHIDDRPNLTNNFNKNSASRKYFEKTKSNLNLLVKEDYKNLFEKNLKIFSNHELDTKKYDEVFKHDYKFYSIDSVDHNISYFTTNYNLLSRKLFRVSNKKYKFTQYDDISSDFENLISGSKNYHSFFRVYLMILISAFIILNIYYHNYISLLLVSTIFVYFLFMYSNIISFNKKPTKNMIKFDFLINCSKNTNENLFFKSQGIINFNIFTIHHILVQFENFERWNKNCNLEIKDGFVNMTYNSENENYLFKNVQFKFFHSENILYVAEICQNELVNLYHLESNENYSKTKVTFFSIIKNEYPNYYVKSSIKKLKRFFQYLNIENKIQQYFDNEKRELDVEEIENILNKMEIQQNDNETIKEI